MTAVHPKQGQEPCPKCGRPRYVIERCCDEYAGEERTFWNYEPTPARKVRVIVGACPVPTYWWAGLEGTERAAVEVNYHGDRFYLDNEDGSGWAKVTQGRGGPDWGHSELSVVTNVKEAA
jgi:hypothetical protein